MLDLMGFKKEFVSLCRDTLCESGPFDISIEEREVKKAQRGMLNGMLFRKEGMNCAPTLYVEDFYKAYKAGSSIEELSHQAIDVVIQSLDTADVFARDSFTMLSDPASLNVRMLNKSRNKEYLQNVLTRDAGCGFVYIADISSGEFRAVITQELLDETGLSEDELFDTAIRNTEENYPAVMHDLAESVCNPDECENLLERPAGKAPAGAGPGYVLTNSEFYWGAGALFYPGVIAKIHELLGGDFYVLPSSVHELIILAVEDQDPQQLAELVRSANRSVVSENDILADDLYICESGKLCRVSYGGEIPTYSDRLC